MWVPLLSSDSKRPTDQTPTLWLHLPPPGGRTVLTSQVTIQHYHPGKSPMWGHLLFDGTARQSRRWSLTYNCDLEQNCEQWKLAVDTFLCSSAKNLVVQCTEACMYKNVQFRCTAYEVMYASWNTFLGVDVFRFTTFDILLYCTTKESFEQY